MMRAVPKTRSIVVLVHGFMRTGASMLPLAAALRQRGWSPRTVTQLNFHRRIPDLADDLHGRVIRWQKAAERDTGVRPDVHFVTHSMGGIVTRSMLSRHAVPGLNRVVMLGPPNQGSRMAEHMHDKVLRLPWGRFDPLQKLLPGERGQCAEAGDPDAEIGIIAGAPDNPKGWPWSFGSGDGPLSFKPHGEHDGKVSVDEAAWYGARDFLVLPYGHTWMMARPQIVGYVEHFLEHGRFKASRQA